MKEVKFLGNSYNREVDLAEALAMIVMEDLVDEGIQMSVMYLSKTNEIDVEVRGWNNGDYISVYNETGFNSNNEITRETLFIFTEEYADIEEGNYTDYEQYKEINAERIISQIIEKLEDCRSLKD